MTPPRESVGKKDETLQLRVDRPFLDRLTAVAERRYMPLSVLLRTWLSERLLEEDKLANKARTSWERSRLEAISTEGLQSFEPGPVLVAHAYSVGAPARFEIDKIKQDAQLLVPVYWRTDAHSAINQHGIELTRAYKDGAIVSRGQAFKTGELETVVSISSEKGQILSNHLDTAIVETVRSLCLLLSKQDCVLPYLVKVSFLRIKDCVLTDNFLIASTRPFPTFKHDQISLSEILITSEEQIANESAVAEHIISVVDEAWNASGQTCSPSYDSARKWKRKS